MKPIATASSTISARFGLNGLSELGFDPDEWDAAAAEAEEEIEVICAPYYKALEEEPL